MIGIGIRVNQVGGDWGPDMVTNGSFTTDSDWDKYGSWAIAGGKISATAETASANQDIGAIAGKKYKVTFDISNYAGGTLYVRLGATAGLGLGGIFNADGSYSQIITAEEALLRIDGGTAFTGKVDNVTCRQWK